jgi:hypothetical protein
MKKFAVALVAVTLMLGLTTGPAMATTAKPVAAKTTTKHHHKKHKHHKKHTAKTSARVASRHAAKVA